LFTGTEPSLILRSAHHLRFEVGPMDRTQTQDYHGGTSAEEIAALVSLAFGVRLRTGGITRLYFRDDDVVGRPMVQPPEAVPYLGYSRGQMRVIPGAAREVDLAPEAIDLLARYPLLAAQDAIVVARAARLYQNGLWVSELEPALAWIMLVSAVEAAANRAWCEDQPPLDLLIRAKPALAEACRAAGGEAHVNEVAGLIAEGMKATVKFLRFLEQYHPGPPGTRPNRAQIQWEWTRTGLRGALATVYDYRSRALHDGVPFPLPMCFPPMGVGGVPDERSLGGGIQALGGTWTGEDLPMFLHIFDYIVRKSLVAWWRSLPTERLHEPAFAAVPPQE
jgi:hypothetical protein